MAQAHDCLTVDEILSHFSSRKAVAQEKYREFVQAGIHSPSLWEDPTAQNLLGVEGFAEAFRHLLAEKLSARKAFATRVEPQTVGPWESLGSAAGHKVTPVGKDSYRLFYLGLAFGLLGGPFLRSNTHPSFLQFVHYHFGAGVALIGKLGNLGHEALELDANLFRLLHGGLLIGFHEAQIAPISDQLEGLKAKPKN